MDLSVFAKEKFSAKDWVNNMFHQSEAQANPETFASSVVMKLQLAIFEISTSLENTSGAVVQSLPRLLRDIELLQSEVVHFQRKLSTVEQEVSKVEKDTTHSLSYLIKLDAVKTKLKATTKALQEADNWTTLMADIEELFESNDLMALSQRLSSLRQSLDLLGHVSDYGERMLQLDGLRNRLEAMASPHLVASISSGDADKTILMVQVFTNMDRLEQLLHYYTKCRRGAVLHRWKELCEQESSDDLDAVSVVCRFYEHLLTDLQEQTKWYSNVFHRPSSSTSRVLLPIYTQALSALDPSPLHDLESFLIRQPNAEEALSILSTLKGGADRLAHGFEAHFRDAGCSLSSEEETLSQFGESLYQLFRLIISNKYKPLCLQHLTEQFASTKSGAFGDDIMEAGVAEAVHSLRQSHSKISSLMESSLNDCVALTQGAALQLLLEAWNSFLVKYLKRYRLVMKQLKNIQDDSAMLHPALSLLQTIGEFLLVLEDCDSLVATQVRNSARKLEESASGQPLGRCKTLYLEPQCLQRLEQIFQDQKQSASHSFLKQSISPVLELNTEVQRCIFEALMGPIRQQMAHLGGTEWAGIIGSGSSGLTEDLPEFGLAPMEYITQVGQYLMMLPQHLEPFVLQENRGLSRSLSEQTFPYGQQQQPGLQDQNPPDSAADFLLGCVAKATANCLSEAILRIESVGAKAAKQLAADIDYLGNIFEDLGLALPSSLAELVELFRAAANSILTSDVSQFKNASVGKDHRLVAAVRSLTNLPSHD